MNEMEQDHQHTLMLRNRLLDGLKDIDAMHIMVIWIKFLPILILVLSLLKESLLMALRFSCIFRLSLYFASLEPSYVLRAIGRNDELAHSSIRFGFGRFTTKEDVDFAISKISDAVNKLRQCHHFGKCIMKALI